MHTSDTPVHFFYIKLQFINLAIEYHKPKTSIGIQSCMSKCVSKRSKMCQTKLKVSDKGILLKIL